MDPIGGTDAHPGAAHVEGRQEADRIDWLWERPRSRGGDTDTGHP